jgi:methanethiol oxidase
MSHQAGQRPASFHSSPQEALQAPPEELVYVACLHVGTGVDRPDFLAVVDVNPRRQRDGNLYHSSA